MGDITMEDARGLSEACWSCAAGRRYLLLILDETHLGAISPQVRKASLEALKNLPVRGCAVVGASIEKRVLNGFMHKGINLILRLDNPLRFFDTEQHAREWIRERRTTLSAEHR